MQGIPHAVDSFIDEEMRVFFVVLFFGKFLGA